jgi:hypothetical protein
MEMMSKRINKRNSKRNKNNKKRGSKKINSNRNKMNNKMENRMKMIRISKSLLLRLTLQRRLEETKLVMLVSI